MTNDIPKIEPNDKCHCGSGKKYKKCCRQKDIREQMDVIGIIRDSKIKQCLHPDSKCCSGGIIRAHSIQNSKILKAIASDGKLLMFHPKLSQPFEEITEYGRGEATTFTGFCKHHDNILFEPIEDHMFDKSSKHIFLYTYRCFAKEYHGKKETALAAKNMEQALFKRNAEIHKTSSSTLNNYKSSCELSINDLNRVKDVFDKAILTENYNVLTSIVWEFNQSVKFAGSGFTILTKDLLGNNIQSCLNDISRPIFITVFPEEETAYCIISWIKDDDIVYSELYQQLNKLTIDEQKAFITNILISNTDNIVMNPNSWKSLDEAKKSVALSIGHAASLSLLMPQFMDTHLLDNSGFTLFDLM